MAFKFDKEACLACSAAGTTCFDDRRLSPIPGRPKTRFQIRQHRLGDCAFEEFVPGTDGDPEPRRAFSEYTNQMRLNIHSAGEMIFGSDFTLGEGAISKVHGDLYETVEAAALWNATAAWNNYMESGAWTSTVFTCPTGTVAAKSRKIAVVKLPRNYDATLLFKDEVRAEILAFSQALARQGMELGLSSPDIVGVRLPHPLPADCEAFMHPLANLSTPNRELLNSAYRQLVGKLDARSFLFAIAVKTSTRADRLYQPLFEAMVLKFLICYVLRGSSFKFHAHLESFEGADVIGRYKAADLTSILLGGQFRRAIDSVYQSVRPAETAQTIIDDYPSFPI